jgi:hypothetical protein
MSVRQPHFIGSIRADSHTWRPGEQEQPTLDHLDNVRTAMGHASDHFDQRLRDHLPMHLKGDADRLRRLLAEADRQLMLAAAKVAETSEHAARFSR